MLPAFITMHALAFENNATILVNFSQLRGCVFIHLLGTTKCSSKC